MSRLCSKTDVFSLEVQFSRAYYFLREAVRRDEDGELDQLGKDGMIQRFEICIELAWKTMKDYLESQNVIFSQITPRMVLKESIATKLVSDGEGWMSALDARNKMSHTYDLRKFEDIVGKIHDMYLSYLDELYEKLSKENESLDYD